MQQIRFRLGLCPRPCWESSRRSPRPRSWILGCPTFKGKEAKGKGRAREEREGQKEEGEKRRDKREKGRGGEGRRDLQLKFLATLLTRTIILNFNLAKPYDKLDCKLSQVSGKRRQLAPFKFWLSKDCGKIFSENCRPEVQNSRLRNYFLNVKEKIEMFSTR